jgi:hypothetical protein
MNLRRGFFRLWLVISILWIGAATWFLWDVVFDPWADFLPIKNGTVGDETALPDAPWVIAATAGRRYALTLIFIPPIALLGLGLVSLWVARGFALPQSK